MYKLVKCKIQATACFDKVFGGKSFILTGDPGQLPHLWQTSLFTMPNHHVLLVSKFDKVIVNQRVQGMTPEQIMFRDLLSRLRKGESTTEDWDVLLSRQPSRISNLAEFKDAIRLFYSNEQVANYNHEQLSRLEQPIAHINARHSSIVAKKMPSEDMSGLEPVVFLAKGARVMLTMNLWSSVGLCNGATGTVVDFIFQNDHHHQHCQLL